MSGFTSKMASRAMVEMGMKKKQRQNKALVDEIAATILLQEYLQGRGNKFVFLQFCIYYDFTYCGIWHTDPAGGEQGYYPDYLTWPKLIENIGDDVFE